MTLEAMTLEAIASDITVDPRVGLMATLQFLGATGTVTGSRFVVRTSRATVLVDAGMFQGRKQDRKLNWEPFPVDPHSIDAVVVTHAHIDHSGWLPGLARDGYRGPVFATTATCELLGSPPGGTGTVRERTRIQQAPSGARAVHHRGR
jgi:metallo-beta-lactamase family protein